MQTRDAELRLDPISLQKSWHEIPQRQAPDLSVHAERETSRILQHGDPEEGESTAS